MGEKVIFVDIDGPLLPGRQWYSSDNMNVLLQSNDNINVIRSQIALKKQIRFDPVAVWLINTLIKETDAQVVLSTTWANFTSISDLKQIFKKNGLSVNFHEDPVTPKKMSSYRSHEILWWLEDHPEITDFAIIDDDYYVEPNMLKGLGGQFASIADNVVFVDFFNGLSKDNLKKAFSIFGLSLNEIYHKYTTLK